MFLYRTWLVMAITTIMIPKVCFSETSTRQKVTHVMSFEHYGKLMAINTGYSKDDKPKLSKEEANEHPGKVRNAIDELYRQLSCGYTFDLLYYMNLLGRLFSENGEKELVELTLNDQKTYTDVFLGQNCIDMFTVLYHFGRTKAMGPIWLVYMYVKYLMSFDKNEIVARRENILTEHHNVYRRLTHMLNKQKCETRNWHNDQYEESEYFKRYTLPLNRPEKLVKLVEILKRSLYNRYQNVLKLIIMDSRDALYFSDAHLRLEYIWMREDVVKHLFVDFAEIPEWENTYTQIKNVNEKIQFDTLQESIETVAKSQSLFMNLVKFIMFHTCWKILTLINLSLPRSDDEEQTNQLWQPWINRDQIVILKTTIAWYVEESIVYFSLNDDLGLAYLKYLFTVPANLFTNVQFNKTAKECLLKYMDEIYSQVFGFETKLIRSAGLISTKYIVDRMTVLKEIHTKFNFEKNDFFQIAFIHNNFIDVNFSISCFYRLIRVGCLNVYAGIEFDIIRSFNDFSDEFLGITSY